MRHTSLITVYFTLLIALICQLYPWQGQGVIFRPDFMLVVLLYWVMRAPNLCTITAFLALAYQRRLVLFNPWQLTVYIIVLLTTARILMLLLKLFEGNDNLGMHHLWPVVTGLVLWQVLILIFGRLTRPKSN